MGYDSVKRFVRRLGRSTPLPFRRLECAPGAEGQLDFGAGAPVIGPGGRRRRTSFLRITLSHSRKGYTEATFRQTTEDLIRCLENAFHEFGGAPETLVFDLQQRTWNFASALAAQPRHSDRVGTAWA